MNIFDLYLDKIKDVLSSLSKNNEIILPESLEGINAEIPPAKFDCDISTNVAMVLSKANKKSPIDLGNVISKSLVEKDKMIERAEVVKPGFININ